MNKGTFGIRGRQGVHLPPVPGMLIKIADINMVGKRPLVAEPLDIRLPKDIIFVKVALVDFRWTTGTHTYTFGLVNHVGTSAPLTSYTIDSVTAISQMGASLEYMVGGRFNTVDGVVNLNGTITAPGTASSIAITAPPADRFRYYQVAGVPIISGKLIIYGISR